ncbi:MAG: methyltransferase domain-containing protein [Streptosporangiales bacterium]|nr:methyltransferase domain-containing protein [Streptosporangiales bacterium]
MREERVRPSPASHIAASDSLTAYWTFYWAVATAQLSRWLPSRPARLLDLGGPRWRSALHAATAGHDIVDLSDGTALSCFTDGCFDAVLADDRALSKHLATEQLMDEIARVLRPGGRVFGSADSLVLGMAILAEQHHWPELSTLAGDDVFLVPWPDGAITRCFGPEQFRELFTDAGLEVEWIRPRTVLSPSTVEAALAEDPDALPRLVELELNVPARDESLGIHLVASGRKPDAARGR